jgi:hypothetical protein
MSPVNGYTAKDSCANKYADAITEHLIMAWQWLMRESNQSSIERF